MNLLQLRYFSELAATQHYTRAAERLCITQPSLSHAMAQLEAELGVPLFEKSGRGTVLTHYGRQFLHCVRQTLETLDAGVEELRRVSQGEGLIRLGLIRPLGVELVPKLAEAFLKANSDKNIRFTFQTGTTGELLDGLRARKYDLIFASRPAEGANLVSVAVSQQDLVLIVPKNHPLAAQHVIDLAETLPYPQVCFSKGSGMRDIVDELFQKLGAAPRIAYETQEDQVVAGLVAHGFGIAVVQYMDLLLKLEVKILQIARPAWERELCLTYDDSGYLPPAARSFREFVLQTSRASE